ncbi:hypothetical protein CICLE_v10018376mg [Citrus x clementina]|uniref:WAT1-related protein n=1 Tax=Citrus clementina TaxID=85681 RepID=V4UBT5_CITCL|nr:hypothetical protein CICLE_v10018376mg [Citrus x clementina]ESR59687.1 hypothetical protein CICLE_v10018376mg [Citrus x clementina]
MERSNSYKDGLLFTAMVAVECTNVGLNILFKLAASKGMSYFVFVFYSYAATTIVLLFFPFIFRRCFINCYSLKSSFDHQSHYQSKKSSLIC